MCCFSHYTRYGSSLCTEKSPVPPLFLSYFLPVLGHSMGCFLPWSEKFRVSSLELIWKHHHSKFFSQTFSPPEDFPAGSGVKHPPAIEGAAGDVSWIPGSGRSPGGKKRQPSPVSLPGEFQGQRSLISDFHFSELPDILARPPSCTISKVLVGGRHIQGTQCK